MTRPESVDTTCDLQQDHCPARSRASCTFRNSFAAQGREGVSEGLTPAPGGVREARHQGVPGSEAATEGGSQPGGGAEPNAATRTRPRLRQSVHRDQVRSVRLTRDELDTVKRAAEAVGLKTAGFLADAAVAVAQAQGGPKTWLLDQRGRVEELMAAGTQLARAGNNLNQVARVLNSGGQADYADEAVARVLRAAARIEAAAIEMARR
ncbi:mobilisation protein (MobC) [Streptomyces mirabilis]|uniref:Mobilisation protein (MobC) n=1 Tax=Streptomyces mirabilis TaxID=68239 RepID=A0A1I2VM91_9ACTN|nr:mobilisation protein (MobC) [Streptomyces mirabilis]